MSYVLVCLALALSAAIPLNAWQARVRTLPDFGSAYWVSPTGAETWTNCHSTLPLLGTAACSLTTMRSNSVAAGDTVYFRGGAYSYNDAATLISPAVTGTENQKITYRNFGNETPIITNINAGTTHYCARLLTRDYIVIRGLTCVDFNRHIVIENGSDFNEIAYNEVYRTVPINGGIGRGVFVFNGGGSPSTNNWIHHNTIHGLYLDPCGEGGDGIGIASATANDFDSNYNTVEYNTLYAIGHSATDNFSQFNVFRGNFVHNEGFKPYTPNLTGTATGGSTTTLINTAANFTTLGVMTGSFLYVHDLSDPGSGSAKRAVIASITTTTNPNDTLTYAVTTGTPTFTAGHSYSIGCAYFADPDAPGDNMYSHRGFHLDTMSGQRIAAHPDSILFEDNRAGYASSNPENDGAECLAISAGLVIARYNQFFGCAGPGVYFKNGIVSSFNRLYNNTAYFNGRFTGTQFPSNPIVTDAVQLTSTNQSNNVINNIFTANVGGDFSAAIPGSWIVTNNHLAADGDPLFIDPTLDNYSSTTLPDLSLEAASPAVDAGIHLTEAVGTGSAATMLVVGDARYFQDGTWGSSLSDIQADWIAVGTVGNIVQVSAVNYTTQTITLAAPLTWANGDSVWLYKKSDGAIVLIGVAPDQGAKERQE